MEIIYNIENFKKTNKIILALGNFDGVHLAHRKIIKQTKCLAEKREIKSAVFLLDPHPLKILYPYKKLFLLSTLEEKAEILRNMGIDYLIIEKFSEKMAMLSPFKFIQDYLVNALNVVEIVVGFDYTFGRQGKGTTYTLLKWSKMFDFHVEIIPPVMIDNKVVSSSLIRDLIINGEVEKASVYLDGHFQKKGKVIHGEGRGRGLGFPTANLDLDESLLLPSRGVYLSLIFWRDKKFFGLTNIGKKPTFSSSDKTSVEIYLLDFNEDVYDEELTVKFLHRIRDEIPFKDGSYLKKQIENDVNTAKALIEKEYAFLLEKQCT
jgi:riboflavin kinase / FMN adenylyltransferase